MSERELLVSILSVVKRKPKRAHFVWLTLCVLAASACVEERPASSQNQKGSEPSDSDSVSALSRSRPEDRRVGVWAPDDQAMHIRFVEAVETSHVRELVDAFNHRFAPSFGLRLQLQSVEGTTVHVGVSDDRRLTEQMGTTGSQMYVASLTYTLTSLAPIDRVYLDVEEGSHAQPGAYTRQVWADLARDR